MTCQMRRSLIVLLFALLFGSAFPVASALADPPGRVARISFVAGSVSFRPASLDEWSAATLNYPITTGDHIWTDNLARTELQIGGTTVRVGPFTEMSLLNLDDQIAQFRITQGSLSVRVRDLGEDETIEVDTPNGAVSLLRPGFYRVDVNETGEASTVTVRHGEAEVTAGPTAFPVRAEQSASLSGVETPQISLVAPIRIDEFEDWCLARDRRADEALSTRYVSPDMVGYEDLDQYGNWRDVPTDGTVWVPRVQPQWVPYRFGHWAWVDPWGWTWIDDAPWGFAPFHYGRWVNVSGGWCWMPGERVVRPVYAPALVAFVGGNGWRVSASVGEPVAWFPLGPREVYAPPYRVSPVYVTAVNRPHVTVTNVNVTINNNVTYINRGVPGAVTAVPRDTFVRAQPVAQVAVAVPRESVRTAVAGSAPVVGTAVVQPQRASIAGQAVTRAAAPPAAVLNRRVMVRTLPPPVSGPAPAAPVQQVAQPRAVQRQAPANQVAPPAAVPPPPQPQQPQQPQPQRAQPVETVRPAEAPVERRAPQPPAQPAPPQAPPPPARVAAPPAPAAPAAPQPAVVRPTTPPAQSPQELAQRHAQERAALQAQHDAERAQLQAKHQEEERAAQAAQQRAQIQQQHQAELKAMQDRQKQERDAVQKRQADERKQQQQPKKQ
jgi:hypothetical protein